MTKTRIDRRSLLSGMALGSGLTIGGGAIYLGSQGNWPADVIRPATRDDRYFNSMTRFDPRRSAMSLHYNLTPATNPQTAWRGSVSAKKLDLPQGLYVVASEDGIKAPLAVTARPGEPEAPVCVLVPDYTIHAYNKVGGGSLYTENEWVSIRRPHVNAWYSAWGYHPFDLIEAAGLDYDIILQSDLDVDLFEYDLASYSKIVLYGHDEYWTGTIRSKIESAVAAGTTLVNLSGNTCYWRLERDGDLINRNLHELWETDTDFGGEERLLGAAFRWAGYPVKRKIRPNTSDDVRNQLLAHGFPSDFMGDDFDEKTGSIRITNADSTLLAGSGLKNGDWLGGAWPVLDIEFDGLPLDRDGKIDLTKTQGFVPDELEVSAEGWGIRKSYDDILNPKVTRFAFGVSSRFRKGGMVHSLPSISWVRAAQDTGGVLRQITLNALTA